MDLTLLLNPANFHLYLIHLDQALCESSSHITPTSSSPAGDSSVLHGDSIQFDLVPDIVMNGSVVQVSYQCSRACEVGVEVMVPTQTKTGVAVFRRRWTNHRRLHVPRTHPVKLWFPPGMAYRKDLFMRRTLDVHNVMVRAWLDHLEQGKGDKGHVNRTSTYNGSLVRTFKVLQAVLPSERPARLYPGCPSWMADLMWQLTRDRIRQCPHESGLVSINQSGFVLYVCVTIRLTLLSSTLYDKQFGASELRHRKKNTDIIYFVKEVILSPC